MGPGSSTPHKFILNPNGTLQFKNLSNTDNDISGETHAQNTQSIFSCLIISINCSIFSSEGRSPFFFKCIQIKTFLFNFLDILRAALTSLVLLITSKYKKSVNSLKISACSNISSSINLISRSSVI